MGIEHISSRNIVEEKKEGKGEACGGRGVWRRSKAKTNGEGRGQRAQGRS